MNKYVCMQRGKTIDVSAESQYKAQVQGAMMLKAKRTWEVIVVLVEVAGREVQISTASLQEND